MILVIRYFFVSVFSFSFYLALSSIPLYEGIENGKLLIAISIISIFILEFLEKKLNYVNNKRLLLLSLLISIISIILIYFIYQNFNISKHSYLQKNIFNFYFIIAILISVIRPFLLYTGKIDEIRKL